MGIKNPKELHPATEQLLRWFAYRHLKGAGQGVGLVMLAIAESMVNTLDEGPELSAGLRKLLEAKDCFVRAAIATRQN